MRRSLLLLSLAWSASACGTTYIHVQRRAPAEIMVPTDKPMAVARIEGDGGEALVAELGAAIQKTQRFQLLERQNLGAAVAELKFSSDGYVSDDTAISFGEMTGAQLLTVGRVLASDYKEAVTSAPSKCARDGETVDCTRFTRRADARLHVSLGVVETETGKVIASKTFEATRAQSREADDAEPAEIAAKDAMLAECRGEIVGRFVAVIAPHDVTDRVALKTDGDLPELERGNNFATIGSWSQAVEQYRAAVTRSASPELSDEQRAAARFNLGVGLAYSGAYDAGIAEIEAAYAMDPDHTVKTQLEAVRRLKEEAAKVAAQEPTR